MSANATSARQGPFDHIPRHAGGHFVINLYAAIYRLLHQTRRFAEAAGASLEEVYDRYPFLAEYFNEMRGHMPEDITWDAATQWWEEEIVAWERACDAHLPLRALAEQANLSFGSRLAFMVIGLVEEDSRFGTLLAELQEPLAHRRPTLELAGQMMMDSAQIGEIDPWTVCRPLLTAGVVEVQNKTAPRSEWLLRVPPLLWDAVRGQVAATPASWCRFHAPDEFSAIDELILPETLREKLAKLPVVLTSGRARIVVLRSPPGADALQIAGAVARAQERALIAVEGAALANAEGAQLLGPFAALARGVPCMSFDPAPGETVTLPPLPGYAGPILVLLGQEGGLTGEARETAITLSIAAPDATDRERCWQRFAGGRIVDMPGVVDAFHVGTGFIRKLANSALAQAQLEGRDSIRLGDVQQASRALNRQLLDTLASPITAEGSWSDLVAVPGTRDKLFELERRCRHRERLQGHLGPAFGINSQRGVRALLTGSSGTGKTLSVRILAAVLGMDLYRVDLAAVVNKYIGETEKNLHQVLSRAEALDVVLLLDEGDALLGQRTDVKSANDRYANLETNYLLQRLEHYQGIVVVTTNLGENIDQAFQRRMDVVVPFFPPQSEQRLQIIELHLPRDHEVGDSLIERVALRCALTGSQIRNAVLHGALLAIEDRTPMQDRHLDGGIRSEYRKAGGLCPLDARPGMQELDGGVGSFLAAFARG